MTKEDFEKAVLDAEKSLYHVAHSILFNDEDCADAIQNGIYKAYDKLYTLRKEEYFRTWLTRIVINECYAIIRDRRHFVSLEDYEEKYGDTKGMEDPAKGVEEKEIYLELMKLEENYRLPVILYEIEGYSVKEIAKMLGITEVNVRNRLSRGRAKLRKRLKGGAYVE